MDNRQLAAKFAAGATEGKGSNMFIDGKTIYSYGYHFPIATRYGYRILFTSRNYSMSTAHHKSYVLGALCRLNKTIIYASTTGPDTSLRLPTAAERTERKREAFQAAINEEKRQERRAKREAKKAIERAEAERIAAPKWTGEAVPAVEMAGPIEPAKPYDYIADMMMHESGDLDDAGTARLFAYLIKTGMAWRLQGTYERTAKSFIERGIISKSGLILIEVA